MPAHLVNRASARAFNEAWFRKAPRTRVGEIQSIEAFFHPLDGVAGWNRVYGHRGFVQHQLVVPFEAGDVLRRVLSRLTAGGAPTFLGVLKRFRGGRPRVPLLSPPWLDLGRRHSGRSLGLGRTPR